MHRRIALVVLLVVLANACASGGDEPGSADSAARLTAERTRLSWKGKRFERVSPPDENVGSPRSRGDVFAFDVALGEEYWDDHDGSVHVAIRWMDAERLADEAAGDLFSLYVYADDELLAVQEGYRQDISTGQSLDIGQALDGRYEVVVVPFRVRDSAYEGTVLVQPAPPEELVPDLVPRQPTSFTFTVPGSEPHTSCLDIEKREHPGLERCLRFDATISNTGAGPFITEANITEVVEQREESVRAGREPEGEIAQVVMGADGGERRIRKGRWVIDREHAHAHVVDLAAFELFRVADDGKRTLLVTDDKIGFCPWDLIDERFGKRGSTARVYPADACAVPQRRRGSDPVIRTIGISAGWADVYPARRPIQYVDATGLTDGIYDVVIRVDPNGWFEEADVSNNEAATRIRVAGDGITCVPEPYGCPRHFTPRR